MNMALGREVTAVSRQLMMIRVDVPNKSALLWMSCLSQYVGNICAADLIILLVKNIYKY